MFKIGPYLLNKTYSVPAQYGARDIGKNNDETGRYRYCYALSSKSKAVAKNTDAKVILTIIGFPGCRRFSGGKKVGCNVKQRLVCCMSVLSRWDSAFSKPGIKHGG